MGKYIPNTDSDRELMLKSLNKKNINELFSGLPKKILLDKELNLPDALCEMELIKHIKSISAKNQNLDDYTSFLGAGVYDHFVPSSINELLSRQEFYTSYTPYQPEISQGTLQAIYEYQTMICELTGMDISNASMYDGATAAAEAAILACYATKRSEILLPKTIHPEYRAVIKTYCAGRKIKVIEINYTNGQLDLYHLESNINSNTAALFVQNPNFFGIIENQKNCIDLLSKNKSLVVSCVDPISLSILKSPGELGADIVVGDGQSLGNSLNFGGPSFGFFTTKKSLLRKIPGRIVGETVDTNGKRGFVLTLQTREQHIRREKATSNICSNQSLNAIASAIYITSLGPSGLREVANLSTQKAHYFYNALIKSGDFQEKFSAPFFKEFVVTSKISPESLNKKLLTDKIIGGYPIGKDYQELGNGWLLAVTEQRTKQEIDRFVEKVVCYGK